MSLLNGYKKNRRRFQRYVIFTSNEYTFDSVLYESNLNAYVSLN